MTHLICTCFNTFLIKEEEKNLSNLSGCPKWLSKSLKVQLQMGIENSKKKFVYFRMEKKKVNSLKWKLF